MLCEQCQQNVSTVYLTQFIDGARKRRQLCRPCAEPLLEAIGPEEQTGATYLEPPANSQPLPETVTISDPVSVRELSEALGLKPFQMIGVFMRMNIFPTVQSPIDFAVAAEACSRIGVLALQREA
jgi:hypothetical protein